MNYGDMADLAFRAIENPMVRYRPDPEPVTQAQFDAEVEHWMRNLDEDQICDVANEISKLVLDAVNVKRTDLIGPMFEAALRAVAERIAHRELYGSVPESVPDEQSAAALVLVKGAQ